MRHAYVTLLGGGDSYLPGVEALGNSIRAVSGDVPRVVMVTPDVSAIVRARLEAQGWRIREIAPIPNPHTEARMLFPRFEQTYTKLRAWELAEFDKIVFLDADTIVLRNLDWLFERPSFAAAPDFFLPDRFNSGVMVLDPSAEVFGAMMRRLGSAPSYDGSDQGFLNAFFEDWYAMPVAHRLPAGCNLHHFVFQFLCAQSKRNEGLFEEVFVVHYTLQKPWRGATLSGGATIWWQNFFEVHPERYAAWKHRLHGLQDWSFESVVAALTD